MMLRSLTRSFRHRNFRLYLVGQLLSLHGTWMQSIAQAWLVYRLTDSSFMLGLVSFLNLAPVLLFGLMGGAVADRYSRFRLFWVTQTLAMLQAFILGALTLSGLVQVGHILILATVLGLVHAFEIPARHALVAGLVERSELPNAIALNSSLFNLARFAGPALAGALIAAFGEGPVFVINGLSYSAVLVALASMRPRPAMHVRPPGSGSPWAGLRFAWGQVPLRYALGLVATISLFATPYLVLMPVFAREVFGGGVQQLGMLVGAAGFGALLAALQLAQREEGGAGLERLIVIAGVLSGIGLLVFSVADSFVFALLILPLIGFAITTLVAGTNTFLQLNAEDGLRGRLMSLFSVVFLGLAPLGNLLAGGIAQHLGAPHTVALCAAVCLLGALLLGSGLLRAKKLDVGG